MLKTIANVRNSQEFKLFEENLRDEYHKVLEFINVNQMEVQPIAVKSTHSAQKPNN